MHSTMDQARMTRDDPRSKHVEGHVADLLTLLEVLEQSSAPDAFLLIQVQGREDFLQFTAVPGAFALDFPLITPRQRTLGPKLRRIASAFDLEVRESRLPSGATFLHVDVPGSATVAAVVVERLLSDLYAVDETTRLLFVSHGCALLE
jgi:hypothetical protein